MRRLEPLPLSPEDLYVSSVLEHLCRKPQGLYFRCKLRQRSTEGDRRDAELMYLAQLWRRGLMSVDHTYTHSGSYGRFAIDGARFGGDL